MGYLQGQPWMSMYEASNCYPRLIQGSTESLPSSLAERIRCGKPWLQWGTTELLRVSQPPYVSEIEDFTSKNGEGKRQNQSKVRIHHWMMGIGLFCVGWTIPVYEELVKVVNIIHDVPRFTHQSSTKIGIHNRKHTFSWDICRVNPEWVCTKHLTVIQDWFRVPLRAYPLA